MPARSRQEFFNMRRILIAVCLLPLTTAIMVERAVAASWDGLRIMPKSRQINLMESPLLKTLAGDSSKIEWPATVIKHGGQWLKIADSGAYDPGRLEGWILKDSVLKLDDVPLHCATQLAKSGLAETDKAFLCWMRGVYWENQQEVQSALRDFDKAIDADSQFVDARIRRDRARTQLAALIDAGLPSTDSASHLLQLSIDDLRAEQERLIHRNPRWHPRFDVDLGDALIARFALTGAPADR